MPTVSLKKDFHLLACIVCIFMSLQACKKEENEKAQTMLPPVSVADMVACHQSAAWDSSAIHSKLIGGWNWEYIQCYWNPEDGNYEDYKNVSIEFKDDNSVELSENGQVKQTSHWELVLLNDGNYGLTTTPLIVYLPGRIFFCTNRVLFSDTYTDGCDNYFKKKE